jgi:hypothetical protein
MFRVHWKTEVSVPELKLLLAELRQLKEGVMAGLEGLHQALDGLAERIAQEIEQWGQQHMIDPAEVAVLTERINGMAQQVRDIIPGDPVEEEPPA